jgi:hypothetical protein
MARSAFLSFRRESIRSRSSVRKIPRPRAVLPWIETPIDERDGGSPHLFRHTDATPIELFFDLFFVANLSTFTATHEISNLEALWAYVGFLSIIWFTWLQVTLFDIRFARDSIFERVCKAMQLVAMVGFASAGSRFTTRVRDENVWAFQALSALLAGSRLMLAVQYMINIGFLYKKMRIAAKGMFMIAVVLSASSFSYTGLYFAMSPTGPYIWTVWFGLFLLETLVVMGVSGYTPGLGFEDTHLNIRMALLTLMIIGEAAMSVTRIVNKMVGPGGWTSHSFVHILGVTITVYLLWQSYYDITPRVRFGKIRQQIWTQLHFPFHVMLILTSEGSQILALTLDVALKVRYLVETFAFACEKPRPKPLDAIRLINSTIADMEIDFSRGALEEKKTIESFLNALRSSPYIICPGNQNSLTKPQVDHFVSNVTTSLFSSMGITTDESSHERKIVRYFQLLGFVYIYYFVVTSLAIAHFSLFVLLAHRHPRKLYRGIAFSTRLVLAILLMSLASFIRYFSLTFYFMTSPMIIFTFTLTLFAVLLIDRLLDWLAAREKLAGERLSLSE